VNQNNERKESCFHGTLLSRSEARVSGPFLPLSRSFAASIRLILRMKKQSDCSRHDDPNLEKGKVGICSDLLCAFGSRA
jgi:hypothetical protein